MATITDLFEKIEDPALRDRIKKEYLKTVDPHQFGLVFEDHLPECTPLFDVKIKVGSVVALKLGDVSERYLVTAINGNVCECINLQDKTNKSFNTEDIVVVAEFGQPIYPYLQRIDSVSRNPEAFCHSLIQADNYHALQLLTYLYAGKVSCIYIDPPYNKEKTWKYNNNFVDAVDQYRHSKWLAFMERRLKLAKQLLNPEHGVMIVTIDKYEFARLKLLIEQVFGKAYNVDEIIIQHNPRGAQGDNFSYTNEVAIFVTPYKSEARGKKGKKVILDRKLQPDEIDWRDLRDNGGESLRTDARNCFYPIYVKDGEVIGFGDVSPNEEHPKQNVYDAETDTYAIYPIDVNGIERKWRYARQSVDGIKHLLRVKTTKRGLDIELGKDFGSYKTVWTGSQYDANAYGTKLLQKILGSREFPYPKSVYAVFECLEAVVGNNKQALIVDFFAGSGTTLHAVNLLNARDGGSRKCIMVTNNELSPEEESKLIKKGLKPGDKEWEDLGIAKYVTWARTKCSINGLDIDGNAIKGNYGCDVEFYDEIDAEVTDADTGKKIRGKVYKKAKKPLYPELADMKMADGFNTNCEFFKLGFLDKDEVALGLQFENLIPILWMKAGMNGACPEVKYEDKKSLYSLPSNQFAILAKPQGKTALIKELSEHPEIKTVYVVTDSNTTYRIIIADLEGVKPYQLYSDYLDNFRINTGR